MNKTIEVFDDWAERGRAEGMEAGHGARAQAALDAIPLESGQRVLDLGCGNGWATRWLRAQTGPGGSAVGVDAAPLMVERARSQSEAVGGVSFEVALFEALPWGAGEFDHAFSLEALYYSVDLPEALREIRRVLKPGGTLTIGTEFYEENPHCHGWPDMMQIPMKLMAEQGWIGALEAAGFKVTKTFRCLDPRPVDPEWSAEKQASERQFRTEIGALALCAVREPSGTS